MNQNIVNDLKDFDWQKIIDYGNSLDDLNDAQYRFAKGLAVETSVEKLSNGNLVYVGEKHKDYNWPKHDVTVELKSILSQRMYDRHGEVKTLPNIRLNNSMGTNKDALDPAAVADVLLVVLRDGAYALDKATVLAKAKHLGDGWELKVTKDDITPISGCIKTKNVYKTNLAESIRGAIKQSMDVL